MSADDELIQTTDRAGQRFPELAELGEPRTRSLIRLVRGVVEDGVKGGATNPFHLRNAAFAKVKLRSDYDEIRTLLGVEVLLEIIEWLVMWLLALRRRLA